MDLQLILGRLNKLISFICILFSIILFSNSPNYSFDTDDDNSTNILFLGNSFTGWNEMPFMVKSFGDSSGVEIYVDTYLLYGRSLYEISIAAAFETKIKSKDWDYIIMQDSPYRIAYPLDFLDSNPLFPAIQRIKYLANLQNQKTEFLFFLPWAYEDGQFWVEPDGDDYFEMQRKIIDNTIKMGEQFELLIAPVGFAWNALISSGNEIKLFEDDLTHPTVEGSYLAASVIFSTIFNLPVTENSFHADLSYEIGSYIQDLATETVFNSGFNWNFITDIAQEENAKQEIFMQNYPNPFNAETTINYSISKSEFVTIKIFNNIGQHVNTLLNSKMPKGMHQVIFDAKSFPSGVYYCVLKSESASLTKPIILLK